MFTPPLIIPHETSREKQIKCLLEQAKMYNVEIDKDLYILVLRAVYQVQDDKRAEVFDNFGRIITPMLDKVFEMQKNVKEEV